MPKRFRSYTAEYFDKDGNLKYTEQVYGETRSEAQKVALQRMFQLDCARVQVEYIFD